MVIRKGKILSRSGVLSFKKIIYEFYQKNRRDLPWRNTDDPYRIVVSEFMLQQTQVERVLGKYELFVSRFPDICSLADAPLKDVLNVWQGLGYNRRALALIRLAQVIRDSYDGEFPADFSTLITLPGIGPATAGCILSFAFRSPVVFIETNIRRVFIHHFFRDRERINDREIVPLVEATLDRENPRDWYYALMDYGSVLRRQVDNPNKRSSHYSRQPAYGTSDRKIRGEVLRALIKVPALTDKQMTEMTGAEEQRLERILSDLVNEGFINRIHDSYEICGNMGVRVQVSGVSNNTNP